MPRAKRQLLHCAHDDRPEKKRNAQQQRHEGAGLLFTKLPVELVQDILELAFFLPSSKKKSSKLQALRSRPLDIKTVLNVLKTSQAFHTAALPYLYYEVHLTRPSSLAIFHGALQRRPFLGKLVKRLTIGDRDPLPESWWPGRSGDKSQPLFMSRLGKAYWRSASKRAPGECCGIFALDAIHTALKAMQIFYGEPDPHTHPSDIMAWLGAAYQVSAAMELYSLELKRAKAGRDRSAAAERERYPDRLAASTPMCNAPHCGHYAPLEIVEETAMHGTRSNSGTFQLSRATILAHLLRRGGPVDRFDHPVLFARSELAICDFDHRNHPRLSYAMATQELAETLGETIELDHTTFKGVIALVAAVLKLCGDARVITLQKLLERNIEYGRKLVEERGKAEEVANILCGMASTVRDG